MDLVAGPGPWLAFAVGLVLLAGWLIVLSKLGRNPMSARPRRFDIAAMTSAERRWNLALAAFGIGLIGWLNGAATVDWGILAPTLVAGRAGSVLLAVGLALFLVTMIAGVLFSWRRARGAYRGRARG